MSSYNFTKESLKKGEQFKFSKDEGLSKIRIDLTWKGEADLDVCAFLVGEDGILAHKEDFVYYNSEHRWRPQSEENPTEGQIESFSMPNHRTKKNWKKMTVPVSVDFSVIGSPDVTGDKENDDEVNCETMHVVLDRVGSDIRAIVIGGAIYPNTEKPMTFKQVIEPSLIITDEATNNVLCRFDIKESFGDETALEAGRILLSEEGEWIFEPIGKGYTGGMPTLADIYA